MNWLVFSYSLPSKGQSSPRVTLWRRLRRLGDLRDGIYNRPEAAGVEAILRGWLLAGLLDTELESRGIALFEGLYTLLSRKESKPKNM